MLFVLIKKYHQLEHLNTKYSHLSFKLSGNDYEQKTLNMLGWKCLINLYLHAIDEIQIRRKSSLCSFWKVSYSKSHKT